DEKVVAVVVGDGRVRGRRPGLRVDLGKVEAEREPGCKRESDGGVVRAEAQPGRVGIDSPIDVDQVQSVDDDIETRLEVKRGIKNGPERKKPPGSRRVDGDARS